MGLVQGVCESCGKTIRRKSPIPLVVSCDCYKECPLCGAPMEPYVPDLSPRAYRNEDDPEWDPLGSAEKDEASTLTVYACYNHNPPYYSTRLSIEVKLE